MESIRLLNIEKNENQIKYKYTCDGKISKALRREKEYLIEYGFDITHIPDSILTVPFLANLLPIVWVYDAEIHVDEIDEDFLMCLDDVKRAYSEMYPNIKFKGTIITNKIVSNDIVDDKNRSMLFFSGGVDAVYSLINLRKELPLLCTIWGSDLFFQDKEGWNNVSLQVRETAQDFGLDYTFIKTSFRSILNYNILNKDFAKPSHENWWHGFQHGIAILAHGAPIAYYFGIRRINLVATVSVKSIEDYTCASTPAIDNNVKFCGCYCIHEGVESSRNDKIRRICRFSRTANKKIRLRVCWEQRTGSNCCLCEKCARTYMAIFSEGYDPIEFGFDLSPEIYQTVKDKIISSKLKIPIVFWKDIIRGLSDKRELLEENVLADYIVNRYSEYGKSSIRYIPTIVEKENKAIKAVLLERQHDYSTVSSSFKSVGLNSGNLVFREALLHNLSLANMSYEDYCQMPERFKGLPIVTTDLIWINENSDFDYLYNRVQQLKDIAFVPMSVGLQAKSFRTDFRLNDSVKRVLAAIQERAVIGVRGEYTAEILNKHGIKNIDVIGCPSLYYENNPDFKISRTNYPIQKVCVNFRTFYGLLSVKEKHFLTYCANRRYDFVEQTDYMFSPENAADTAYYNYVSKWIDHKKKLFFDVDEWKNYLADFQFSMGLRFHGNVVALWNRIPALFFIIDSRTEELVRYFNLPFLKMQDFDDRKPIEYYYELADYTLFNSNYEKKFLKYQEFLRKNKILTHSEG